jgi:hypothetical protein
LKAKECERKRLAKEAKARKQAAFEAEVRTTETLGPDNEMEVVNLPGNFDELGEQVMMFMTWMEMFLNSPEHTHQVDMKKWLHFQVAAEAKWDTTENHMSCRHLNQDRVELFIKNPAFLQQQFSVALNG